MSPGFGGEIRRRDPVGQANPAAAAVSVGFPVTAMFTGRQARFAHVMSPGFSGGRDPVRFAPTGIALTGESTARITGESTMNGVTRPVTLEARPNGAGMHQIENRDRAGFDATTGRLEKPMALTGLA
jgi:polyisoprenoid-binding protein YceI